MERESETIGFESSVQIVARTVRAQPLPTLLPVPLTGLFEQIVRPSVEAGLGQGEGPRTRRHVPRIGCRATRIIVAQTGVERRRDVSDEIHASERRAKTR